MRHKRGAVLIRPQVATHGPRCEATQAAVVTRSRGNLYEFNKAGRAGVDALNPGSCCV